jgi:hypothetical protein
VAAKPAVDAQDVRAWCGVAVLVFPLSFFFRTKNKGKNNNNADL